MIHMFATWQFRFGVPVGKPASHAVKFVVDSCNALWLSAGRNRYGTYVNIGPFQILWW